MLNSSEKVNVDTIIFDVDGTLFNGQSLSLPIFKNCLSIYIFTDLLPEAPLEVINSLTECVQKAEISDLQNGKGELFNNVLTVLSTLKDRGYKLAICTNAPKGYFNAMVERFQFKKYFQVMLAAGLFVNKDKIWMVQEILKKLNSEDFAVVGDRYHDIEAAKANNGLSVGCAYGFGLKEVEKADHIIEEFNELLNIFP
ncbi:MAG: HAD family hydrolase [Candidatus Hodarchaeales archaeon]